MFKPKITRECPFDSASILSKAFFGWMIPLLTTGYRKDFEYHDLHVHPKGDDPQLLAKRLERNWLKELEKKKPSIARALISTFGPQFWCISIPYAIMEVQKILQPLLLGVLIKFFDEPINGKISQQTAYLSMGGLVASNVAFVIMRNYLNLEQMRNGTAIETALKMLIYKKILKVNKGSLQETSLGQITNVISNDLGRYGYFAHQAIYLLIAPLQTFITICLMWQKVGFGCVGGICVAFMLIGLQNLCEKFYERFRQEEAKQTDKRATLLGEIFSAIKLIKLYAWEKSFSAEVEEVRRKELDAIRNRNAVNSMNLAVTYAGHKLMLFGCLLIYVALDGRLDTATVFILLSSFNTVADSIVGCFPYALNTLFLTMGVNERVQNVLLLDEKKQLEMANELSSGCLHFENYTAKWHKGLKSNNLTDLTLRGDPGELVAVVGPVGAGKTCLLNALLGEIETVSGSCSVNGRISYSPQESWCFSGTLRDNILLGDEYEKRKLQEVVDVCGLVKDLEMMPLGDQTIVGEKGYTLSGGQKARITLARAVYHEADIYLLDDPLSAVDPHVARHIFDKCIVKYLKEKRSKTIVLVTHQLQFIKSCDRIVALEKGSVNAIGTYKEIMSKDLEFLSILKKAHGNDFVDSVTTKKEEQLKVDEEEQEKKSDPKMDKKQSGAIKWKVYKGYFTSGATGFQLLLLSIIIISVQALYNFTDVWISRWSASFDSRRSQSTESPSQGCDLVIYSILTLGIFFGSFGKGYLISIFCCRCSQRLHERVFKRLLNVPMAFHEKNSIGKVLNVLTADFGVLDVWLPVSISSMAEGLLDCLGIVVLSLTVAPVLFFPAFLFACLITFVRNVYIKTSRNLSRLNATANDPIIAHISTTFEGLGSIRALAVEDKFELQLAHYLKDFVSLNFMSMNSSRVMCLATELIGACYILLVCLSLMAFKDGLTGGHAAVVLASAMHLSSLINSAVWHTASFENRMVTAERILEFDDLEIEEQESSASVSEKWPESGRVEFKNVSLFYPGCEEASLEDISFKVQSGQKIGVVGRTGAGKSSLLTALFRLVEPCGSLTIDGQEIKGILLATLRKNISIIPQDPILFRGTVRRNLDPFVEFSDKAIWKSLEEASLQDIVRGMDKGLNGHIAEGGSNLSVGQRQLLCLARALLRKNKIIVLDEATASVDHETDLLIQKTIRTKFSDATVITIAHRLNTVIDMDKILVMGAGKVIEFDEPRSLLALKRHFYDMVEQTGSELSRTLHEQAESAFKNRRLTSQVL